MYWASPAGVFAETFRRLQRRGIVPGVLYPAVDIPSAEQLAADRQRAAAPELAQLLGGSGCFLSINRFERKKVCAMPSFSATRSVFQFQLALYRSTPAQSSSQATAQAVRRHAGRRVAVLGCRTWDWRCGGWPA